MKEIVSAFVANPEEAMLLATPDGNCFVVSNKSHADHHARTTGQKLTEYKREDLAKEIADYEKAKADKLNATSKEAAKTEGTAKTEGKKGKK